MKKVICKKPFYTSEIIIKGIVENEIYNSNHELIGYVVKYSADYKTVPRFANFMIEEWDIKEDV